MSVSFNVRFSISECRFFKLPLLVSYVAPWQPQSFLQASLRANRFEGVGSSSLNALIENDWGP